MASPSETGIPLSTLEAAAFGLPLILSSCETHRYFYDLQENRDSFTLFRPGDVDALAEIYYRYYIDFRDKKRAVYNLSHFSPETAYQSIQELYLKKPI